MNSTTLGVFIGLGICALVLVAIAAAKAFRSWFWKHQERVEITTNNVGPTDDALARLLHDDLTGIASSLGSPQELTDSQMEKIGKAVASAMQPQMEILQKTVAQVSVNVLDLADANRKAFYALTGTGQTEDEEIMSLVARIKSRHPEIPMEEAVKQAREFKMYGRGGV